MPARRSAKPKTGSDSDSQGPSTPTPTANSVALDVRRTRSATGTNTVLASQLEGLHLDTRNPTETVQSAIHMITAPRNRNLRLARINEFLQLAQQRSEDWYALLNAIFEGLDANGTITEDLRSNSTLNATYNSQRQQATQRHRDHVRLAQANRRVTREQVGEEFYKMYFSHLPDKPSVWQGIRQLLNWAAENEITAENALKMASRATAKRLKERPRGSVLTRALLKSDIIHAIDAYKADKKPLELSPKNMPKYQAPNTPDWWIDTNGVAWFDRRPPEILLKTPASVSKTQPPKALQLTKQNLELIRKRQRDERRQGSTKKSFKRPRRPLDEDPYVGTPSHIDAKPRQPNIEVVITNDPQTGQKKRETRYDETGTPIRSFTRLTQEWRPKSPFVIPIVPLKKPLFNEWIPSYDSLSQLERDLLSLARNRLDMDINPTPEQFRDPASYESIKTADDEEISNAVLNLRKRVRVSPEHGTANRAGGDNPYKADENQRFFWMLGVVQFLAGLDLSQSLFGPPWTRYVRTQLIALRNQYPAADYPQMPMGRGTQVAMPTAATSLDIWLTDDRGRYQGWANDELVEGMLRHYAQEADRPTHIVNPAAYTVWAQMLLDGNDSQALAPPMDRNAQVTLIPVHRNNHWTLVAIDTFHSRIVHVNSKGTSFEGQLARRFLQANGYNPDHFREETTNPVQQENSADCGFWVIANARSLTREGRLAGPATTGHLRVSVLEDLAYGIRTSNVRATARQPFQSSASRHAQWQENMIRRSERHELKNPHIEGQVGHVTRFLGADGHDKKELEEDVKRALSRGKYLGKKIEDEYFSIMPLSKLQLQMDALAAKEARQDELGDGVEHGDPAVIRSTFQEIESQLSPRSDTSSRLSSIAENLEVPEGLRDLVPDPRRRSK